MERFLKPFVSVRRKPIRQALFRMGYRLGADTLIRKAAEVRRRQISNSLRRRAKLNAC
jgi:hypothetical protein